MRATTTRSRWCRRSTGHGVTLYDLGELESSRRHLERALGLYRQNCGTHATVLQRATIRAIGSRCWLSWLLWMREGDRTRAARRGRRASLADELGRLRVRNRRPCCTATAANPAKEQQRRRSSAARLVTRSRTAFRTTLTVGGIEAWHALASGRLDAAIRLGEAALVAQHEDRGAAHAAGVPHHMLGVAYGFSGTRSIRRWRPWTAASPGRDRATPARSGAGARAAELLGLRASLRHGIGIHRSLELARALERADGRALQSALGMAARHRATGRASACRALRSRFRRRVPRELDTGRCDARPARAIGIAALTALVRTTPPGLRRAVITRHGRGTYRPSGGSGGAARRAHPSSQPPRTGSRSEDVAGAADEARRPGTRRSSSGGAAQNTTSQPTLQRMY